MAAKTQPRSGYVSDRTYRRVIRMLAREPSRPYRDMADKLGVAPSTIGVAVARGLKAGDLKRERCPTCGSHVLAVQPAEEGD